MSKSVRPWTPGPWYAEQPGMGFTTLRQVGTDRIVFALAHPNPKCGDPDVPDEEKYANLALLEHAPDLYDALKDAEGWVEFLRINGCDGGAVVKSLSKIRAALDKANPHRNEVL